MFGTGGKKAEKRIKIFKIASANENSLYQFIHAFSYLLALPRPNCSFQFKPVNIFKLLLISLPSLFISNVWANLLCNYLRPLWIYLLIILRFNVELDYQGPLNAFIFSKNLISAFQNRTIIDKKLVEDLALGRVIEVKDLI